MHPPVAPRTVEHEGHEHVLGRVLRPQQVGVHPPGRGHYRRRRTAVAGLVHEPSALLAKLRQLSSCSQKCRKVAEVIHRAECGAFGP